MECIFEQFTHILHIWVLTRSATLYFLPPDFSFLIQILQIQIVQC